MSELGLTIPNDDYHKDTSRISKSGLDLINRSPAHYWERYINPNPAPRPEKEWQRTGGALGCAVLEPDDFPLRYTILDDIEICKEIGGAKPRSTNKYKDWYDKETIKLQGKIILEPEYYSQLIIMRDKVRAHPACKTILADGISERTFYFTDAQTGVKCRIRPDWITNKLGYLADVKTTENASPEAFGRSAFKFRYHVQDPFYTDGMRENGFVSKGFIFMCVEKEPPHNVAAYFVPPDVERLGRTEYKQNLYTFADCTEKKIWPGYDDLVMPLQFPAYAFTKK